MSPANFTRTLERGLRKVRPTEGIGILAHVGDVWFVDSANGSNSKDGKSFDTAFATITYAYSKAAAGDTIAISGTFSTEAAITCTKAGLRFIGIGTAGPQGAIWSSAADAVSLTINAARVEVANIKFQPPARSAGTPASIAFGTSGSYAYIHHCRFQGKASSWNAIYSAATGADNVRIEYNQFIYLNTATYGAAIKGLNTANAYSGWQIIGNEFNSCVIAIDLPSRCCLIKDNTLIEAGNQADGTLGTVMTTGIHLDGAGSGCNMVTGNVLAGTYNATLYKVGNATGAADIWYGNIVITTGITAANPA